MSRPTIPSELGGPSSGRPIVDSDEFDRLDNAINQMLYPSQIEGSGTHRNLLPFYNSLLVGSVRHVGTAATQIVPTACVFISKDGQLNLAFNPYYIDELQKVHVRWPADEKEAERLRLGKGEDSQVWLVRPSYWRLPSFVRASIFREALQNKLTAEGVPTLPGWLASVPAEVFRTPPEELGIDTSRTIAVRVDNRPLIALFVHEVLHVAHLHLLVDWTRYPDRRRLNLAMDIAIDQFIDEKYNNKWTFFEDLFRILEMPTLERDMPFDYYYQRLGELTEEEKVKRSETIDTQQGPVRIQVGPGQPRQGSGAGQPAGPGMKIGGIQMGPPGPDGVTTITIPMNVDEHDWNKPDNVDKFAQRAWLQNFRQKATEYDAGGKGLGSLLRSIENFLRPSVSWQPYLRRFIGDKVKVGREGTRKRPSRRLGWDSPGRKTIRSGRVVVAIDNSGSISPAECSQFFGEIGSFVGQVDVVVVIWDDGIQDVVHVSSRSDLVRLAKQIGGGGGTNVVPVLEAIRDPSSVEDPNWTRLLSNTQGLIVLTDGDLMWPGPEYETVPTLWGITKESNLGRPQFGLPLFVNLEKEEP